MVAMAAIFDFRSQHFKQFFYLHVTLMLPTGEEAKSRFSTEPRFTVAIAFFLSTETHAKRLLTIWKRSVWTTLKRSFTVLANQSIVSETFQAFRILANQISVRKTLSWKPCLVATNQIKMHGVFFFFFFFSFTYITIQVTVLQM